MSENLAHQFANAEDFKEQFRQAVSEEVKRGLITASFQPNNFSDSANVSLDDDGRINCIHLISMVLEGNDNPETIKHSIEEVLLHIFHFNRDVSRHWQKYVNKENAYLMTVSLLNRADGLEILSDKWDEDFAELIASFVEELLKAVDPSETNHDQNLAIINLIHQYDLGKMLYQNADWLGEYDVVHDLVKRLYDERSQTSFQNLISNECSADDDGYAQQLAIHLAGAGYLDEIFKEKEEQLKILTAPIAAG